MVRIAGLLLLLAGGMAHAEPRLGVELNRLEPRDAGCRASLVIDNGLTHGFDSVRLDLVLFGTDGVIARRLAVEAGPLRPGKRSVKLFDIADLGCDRIGEVLLNDIPQCKSGGADKADCIDLIAATSRAPVRFQK